MAEITPASVQANAGALSLLSLSIVASHAPPIPVAAQTGSELLVPEATSYYDGTGSFHGTGLSGSTANSGTSYSYNSLHTGMKHRRLSSAGQTRRRLSDARDAAVRPSPQTLQTQALSSLAALSLSSTPPPPVQSVFKLEKSVSTGITSAPVFITTEESHEGGQSRSVGANGNSKTGKKRGTIFQCESCSKVYRHPSCLIKHRWEHSPHWREASKFVLSKHQQVQLLEAAAILSHLKPSVSGGTSLPEDRSLWPSFLSGGLLPPPSTTNLAVNGNSSRAKSTSSTPSSFIPTAGAVSSSVPAYKSSGRSGSTGPRLHDYSVTPASGGITHIRPGLVGVPTSDPTPEDIMVAARGPSAPVPVPSTSHNGNLAFIFSSVSGQSESWGSAAQASYQYSSPSMTCSQSESGMGGWSLPSSSLRSRSGSRSDDEDGEYVDIGDSQSRPRFLGRGWEDVSVKEEEEGEWDGMEMEMDMVMD